METQVKDKMIAYHVMQGNKQLYTETTKEKALEIIEIIKRTRKYARLEPLNLKLKEECLLCFNPTCQGCFGIEDEFLGVE